MHSLDSYDLYLLIRAGFVARTPSGDCFDKPIKTQYVFTSAAITLAQKPEPPPFKPTRHNRPPWAFDPDNPPEGPDTGPAPSLLAKAG